MSKNNPKQNDLAGDILFLIRYIPKSVLAGLKYGSAGVVLGLACHYFMTDDLKTFAETHHDAVDFRGDHVPDSEQFMHMSRHSVFNRVEKPVSDILPFYSMFLGGGAGFFYGIGKKAHSFSKELKKDRENRTQSVMDMV